jgi:hypothetical protein
MRFYAILSVIAAFAFGARLGSAWFTLTEQVCYSSPRIAAIRDQLTPGAPQLNRVELDALLKP